MLSKLRWWKFSVVFGQQMCLHLKKSCPCISWKQNCSQFKFEVNRKLDFSHQNFYKAFQNRELIHSFKSKALQNLSRPIHYFNLRLVDQKQKNLPTRRADANVCQVTGSSQFPSDFSFPFDLRKGFSVFSHFKWQSKRSQKWHPNFAFFIPRATVIEQIHRDLKTLIRLVTVFALWLAVNLSRCIWRRDVLY